MKGIKHTFAVYGCGGTGVNLVQDVINVPNAAGFPEVSKYRIDTSSTDIINLEGHGEAYIIPGVRGAGKERKFAYSVAAPHTSDILLKNPPKDFNVVIFSLSGGSGSIIGPLIISELLKRGESVIGVCVGSTASGLEAKNTLDTLATLQSISMDVLKKPLACSIHNNTVHTPRGEVDQAIENFVRGLALLVSGNNASLDDKDIKNWLNYDLVTTVPGQLVDLVLYTGTQGTETGTDKDITAISVASLLPSTDDSAIDLSQPYGCIGYMPIGVLEAGDAELKPMHFIITNELMDDRISDAVNVVNRFKDNTDLLAAKSVKRVEIDADDNGMVF